MNEFASNWYLCLVLLWSNLETDHISHARCSTDLDRKTNLQSFVNAAQYTGINRSYYLNVRICTNFEVTAYLSIIVLWRGDIFLLKSFSITL